MAQVAGFTLEHRIGEGAMGEVWRARAPDGTAVALKIARTEEGDRPDPLGLIEGEVRSLARLDHPNVAWVYDHGRIAEDGPFPAGTPYLVLEHCGGGTLADRRLRRWSEVREVLVGLLHALAYAHAHGIVHRDLKPANVLWSASDDVRPGMKLADFGVAHADGVRAPRQRIGTPRYMAPEQARQGAAVGPWTDLYALGAVAWELVTGRSPNSGEDTAAIIAAAGRPPPPLAPRFPVPDGLEGWLRSLLAADPRTRPRRAADALRALAHLDPEVDGPPDGWQSPQRVGPRLRLQGAGLGLVALRDPELVGRATERRLLWSALDEVRASRSARVVVVGGVRGIGKTRLCRWLVQRVAELGRAETLWVGCAERAPLAALLAGALGVSATGPARVPALRAMLQLAHPDLVDRIEPLLAQPERPWGAVPAVRRLLASPEARVLVLDDADTNDEPIRLARALAAAPEGLPLLVVLAVEDRPNTELDALQAAPEVHRIKLGPLEPSEAEELLRALVGLDPESHSALLAQSGGHPGYLVDQVTSWARRGVLAPTRRGFRRVEKEAPAESWSIVRASGSTRWLATIDEPDRVLLERAAVMGRVVDEDLWDAACDDPEAQVEVGRVAINPRATRQRAALVDALLRAGLAEETEAGFVFTQPALVDELLAGARAAGRYREHHLACANHLRRAPPSPANQLQLGRHLAEAEAWDEAATALVRGAFAAWESQDRRPLLAEVDRARACAERAGWSVVDPRWAEIEDTHALLLLSAGRLDEAIRRAERAWEIARRVRDRALIARTLWRRIDALGLAMRWAEMAELVPYFLQVEDAAPPNKGGLARARYARHLESLGRLDEAAAWFEEAERRLFDLDDPGSEVYLIELYVWQRRYERILEVGAAIEQAALEAGRIDLAMFTTTRRVDAARRLGQFELARRIGDRALQHQARIGDLRVACLMRAQLAEIDVTEGRWTEAVERLQLCLVDADRIELGGLAVVLRIRLATCYFELADHEAFDRNLAGLEGLLDASAPVDPDLHEEVMRLVDALRVRGEPDRAAELERLWAFGATGR